MKKTTLLIAMMAMLALTVGMASADEETNPTIISGTVTYENGSAVSGAAVDVDCYNGDTITTLYDTTTAIGTYYVVFDEVNCAEGDEATVYAEYGDMSGSNSGIVECATGDCPFNVAIVNVTIPEFGVLAAGVALIGAIAGFAVLRKKD